MQQLFYGFIKIWVRLSLKIFCKKVVIRNPENLAAEGPLIIAANHPNSFFDAILIGAHMQQPVHFITRGDVFRKRWAPSILEQLNMMPIYRIRDGKEKLSLNQQTFSRSVEVLKANGIVLIFVEGMCEYQTTLLPLKKGAPRILLSCWQQGINAKVLPVWLRYNSFFSFSKNTEINLGNIFGKEIVSSNVSDGEAITKINKTTSQELLRLYDIRHKFLHLVLLFRWLLAIPAFAGFLFNYPFYILVRSVVYPLTKKDMHYDSVMFGVLTLLYPFYVLLLTFITWHFTHNVYSFLIIVLLPLLARCYVIFKK
ncbi:MAG TPA: 1-acyl-sn-glycerol-3-phosphate acyltransferase [Panacibacter sp.]|nr:1-acyl-sn-glycerol-3-phosphate acyltransferase [Panacibacter sp.]